MASYTACLDYYKCTMDIDIIIRRLYTVKVKKNIDFEVILLKFKYLIYHLLVVCP